VSLNPDLPLVEVASRAEWRSWLEENHTSSSGVWVVTTKKAFVTDPFTHVSSRDLNEECLCFGWIDSKPGRVDERRTALLCTPRKPGSSWSRVNKERFANLAKAGLMTEAGSVIAEAARHDGSWDRLNDVDALVVPDDLARALDGLPEARGHWDGFPPSARRGILEWINSAKKQRTRAQRIATTAELASRNERALAWKPLSH
jgi:uncharacterized protein YdeI (YjbR/CyaY-like superfamily)